RHRHRFGVRDLDGPRRHRPGAVLPALPQQAEGGVMALSVDEAVPGPTDATTVRTRRGGGAGRARTAIEVVLLLVLAAAMLFPVLWILETSIKDGRDVYAVPAQFFGFDATLDHYRDVFVRPGGGRSDLSVAFLNSVLVAGA